MNAAAIKEIGNWLDYLRKNEVFDNTRIIIISDHGRNVYTRAFADFDLLNYEYAHYNALMLVKDFSSNENLKTDMTFMTIADTPLLSIEDLNVSSINPFTGNDLLDFVDKEQVNLYFAPWNPTNNNTFEFDYSLSYSVKDNIFIPSNWNAIKK